MLFSSVKVKICEVDDKEGTIDKSTVHDSLNMMHENSLKSRCSQKVLFSRLIWGKKLVEYLNSSHL